MSNKAKRKECEACEGRGRHLVGHTFGAAMYQTCLRCKGTGRVPMMDDPEQPEWFNKIMRAQQNIELPEGFGDDELSRQMKRNAEPFETWWERNQPKLWWRRSNRATPMLLTIARAAYYREDLNNVPAGQCAPSLAPKPPLQK